MSGAIVDLSKQRPSASMSAEVCIVGSGSGGATAARVLAEAGHEVLVLEEGGDFTGTRLTQRDAPMYDQLYMDRGGRASEDLAVTVLQGRVLGGGGVINACDVVPIPDGVREHWRTRHGLTDLTDETLAPHRARALQDLSASRIAESALNRANQLLRAGTEALGLRGEVMSHNRVGCAGLGTCLLGCPIGAKQNPRSVAIPAAVRAGARFLTRARALRISGAHEELKRIAVGVLDEKGYREVERFEVRARIVILAANAVASAELLLRSGIGNEHVGKHLILQPQLPITAVFPEEVRAFEGIPQAYAVTHFEREDDREHGLWGFRIEAMMGTPGMVASLLPLTGHAGKELMQLYPHIASALLLVPDEPSGRVELTDAAGHPLIRYEHAENHKSRLRDAIRTASRIYLAAGAERVMVPLLRPLVLRSEADLAQLDRVGFAPATAPLMSAHQQGSVRMSPNRADGAADPDARLYDARDIYVFDSSGFPSSASSHTMAPIMTMSHYQGAKLAARLG